MVEYWSENHLAKRKTDGAKLDQPDVMISATEFIPKPRWIVYFTLRVI
jgi:hypothetical protein